MVDKLDRVWIQENNTNPLLSDPYPGQFKYVNPFNKLYYLLTCTKKQSDNRIHIYTSKGKHDMDYVQCKQGDKRIKQSNRGVHALSYFHRQTFYSCPATVLLLTLKYCYLLDYSSPSGLLQKKNENAECLLPTPPRKGILIVDDEPEIEPQPKCCS